MSPANNGTKKGKKNPNPEWLKLSALVFVISRIPLKDEHIRQKHFAYGFQLVRRHCGICRSVNQGSKRRWQTDVSIYNPKNNKHIFTLENTTRLGSGTAFIWAAQRHGEQLEWVVWSMNGSGTTCFITQETLKHWRRPHPSLTDAFIERKMRCSIKRSWLTPFAMQDFLSMMDLHSFVLYFCEGFFCKCAHALLKRTMDPPPPSTHPISVLLQTPSLLAQLILQLSCGCVITEIPRASFSGPCQIISTASTVFSPPPSLPPSLPLSALQGSSCLWGLVLASWFGSSGWLLAAEPAQNPLPVLFPLACLCVCPRWGHSRRTVGVMRSQTALNGPNQAVQTNNLLSLQFSHQEQHSVKCQQQNSLMEQGRKNSNRSYIH